MIYDAMDYIKIYIIRFSKDFRVRPIPGGGVLASLRVTTGLRASFVGQRQSRFVVVLTSCDRSIQLQLLLAAERGDPAAISLEVALRGFEGFLCFVQALAEFSNWFWK